VLEHPSKEAVTGAAVGAAALGKIKSAEVHAIQGDDEERFGSYRAIIRQEFAKKLSVFICMPTAEDASRAYRLLEKGIEGYIFLLHSALPLKKTIEAWNAAVTQKHPVVIIATGGYLCMPRADIGTLIIERENSRNYKSNRRPFVDIRRLAETFAKKKRIGLVYGDMLLTAETLWRETEGEVIQSAPFKFRSLSTASDLLVDMRQYKNSNNQFKILADETEQLIRSNKENNEHMVILAARRGIAPSVVCADCQTIVTCNECSAPVVLHRSAAKMGNDTEHDAVKHFFMCHRCGMRRSSEEYCKICGSWKLGTVGIGIDLVADKIHDKFPDQKVFQVDSDTTKTEKQIHAVIEQFKKQPGSILLGTEMMLTYLDRPVDNAAVVSLDSLFSIPDFRIHEKIMYTLVKLRSFAEKKYIVQTRKADEKIFDFALKGNLSDCYRTIIDDRRMWSYPPFATLVKITLEGKKDDIVTEMASIKKMLEPHSIDIFPAFTHTVRGNYVLHGLMRLTRGNWPVTDIVHKLRSLPPFVTVNIDPDSLL
jgi:primosomal protein N' (replication factor Y)